LYYEDQKSEAKRRTDEFHKHRVPKFFSYFERVIERNGCAEGWMVGDETTYADLSMFQVIDGLRYSFPNLMRRVEREYPKLSSLHGRVADLPRIASYLSSPRRIAFNEDGIFRRYPELDAK
jgi:glutathione S-transferase